MKWMDLFTENTLALHWAVLGAAVISLGMGLAVYWGLRAISWVGPGKLIVEQSRRGVVLFSVVATIRLLLPRVPAFQSFVLQGLALVQVLAIVSLAFAILRVGRGLRLWLDERFDISMPDNLRSRRVRTQIAFLERIFDAAVVVIALGAILFQFESGRKVGAGLFASAGVASLVIGLAAQRAISNLLAGFQIALTSPIRIDDAVVVEGEWGWIEEITLTYVVVRAWDRRRLIYPIAHFVEKPFQNWTRKTGQILGSVMLEVAHHTPFKPLNDELTRLLSSNALWDKDVKVLQVVELKERCVQWRALMTARSSPECWDLRCAIRRGLLEYLVREYPDCLPSTRLTLISAEDESAGQPLHLTGPQSQLDVPAPSS